MIEYELMMKVPGHPDTLVRGSVPAEAVDPLKNYLRGYIDEQFEYDRNGVRFAISFGGDRVAAGALLAELEDA